jgi:hypothetical protein
MAEAAENPEGAEGQEFKAADGAAKAGEELGTDDVDQGGEQSAEEEWDASSWNWRMRTDKPGKTPEEQELIDKVKAAEGTLAPLDGVRDHSAQRNASADLAAARGRLTDYREAHRENYEPPAV